MKFFIYYAKMSNNKEEADIIEIATIEELRELSAKEGDNDLIVSFGEDASITVYDNYIE